MLRDRRLQLKCANTSHTLDFRQYGSFPRENSKPVRLIGDHRRRDHAFAGVSRASREFTRAAAGRLAQGGTLGRPCRAHAAVHGRSEEHTSELQSQFHLVCSLLLEKKKKKKKRKRKKKKKKKEEKRKEKKEKK